MEMLGSENEGYDRDCSIKLYLHQCVNDGVCDKLMSMKVFQSWARGTSNRSHARRGLPSSVPSRPGRGAPRRPSSVWRAHRSPAACGGDRPTRLPPVHGRRGPSPATGRVPRRRPLRPAPCACAPAPAPAAAAPRAGLGQARAAVHARAGGRLACPRGVAASRTPVAGAAAASIGAGGRERQGGCA
jgi:hypothetical protein